MLLNLLKMSFASDNVFEVLPSNINLFHDIGELFTKGSLPHVFDIFLGFTNRLVILFPSFRRVKILPQNVTKSVESPTNKSLDFKIA